jgi:hypothetical protein
VEEINPLPKTSVEDNFALTPNNICIETKEKEKANQMKVRRYRKLKRFEAPQEREKSGGLN